MQCFCLTWKGADDSGGELVWEEKNKLWWQRVCVQPESALHCQLQSITYCAFIPIKIDIVCLLTTCSRDESKFCLVFLSNQLLPLTSFLPAPVVTLQMSVLSHFSIHLTASGVMLNMMFTILYNTKECLFAFVASWHWFWHIKCWHACTPTWHYPPATKQQTDTVRDRLMNICSLVIFFPLQAMAT